MIVSITTTLTSCNWSKTRIEMYRKNRLYEDTSQTEWMKDECGIRYKLFRFRYYENRQLLNLLYINDLCTLQARIVLSSSKANLKIFSNGDMKKKEFLELIRIKKNVGSSKVIDGIHNKQKIIRFFIKNTFLKYILESIPYNSQ